MNSAHLKLIEQYDAGNRSPLLALQVYTVLAMYAEQRHGRSISQKDIDNWNIEDAEALKNGIAFLRRKSSTSTTNNQDHAFFTTMS